MDTDDPVQIRRRQRERARNRTARLLILAGGVLAVACVVAAVLVLRGEGLLRIGGPSESREGETWTHKELAEYLGKRGVQVEIAGGGTIQGQVHSTFRDPAVANMSVNAVLFSDPKAAREDAAAKGAPAFAWGRFVFSAKKPGNDLLARIRKALERLSIRTASGSLTWPVRWVGSG